VSQENNSGCAFFIVLIGWFGGMTMFPKEWSLGSVFWVLGGLFVLYYLGSQMNKEGG
jgi:ABC-type Fe3+-siderophore transport system permease subunit